MRDFFNSKENKSMIKTFVDSCHYWQASFLGENAVNIDFVPEEYGNIKKAYPILKNMALELNLFHEAKIKFSENGIDVDEDKIGTVKSFADLAIQADKFVGQNFREVLPVFDVWNGHLEENIADVANMIDGRESEDERNMLKYVFQGALDMSFVNLENAKRDKEGDMYSYIAQEEFSQKIVEKIGGKGWDLEGGLDDTLKMKAEECLVNLLSDRKKKIDTELFLRELTIDIRECSNIDLEEDDLDALRPVSEKIMPAARKRQVEIKKLGKAQNALRAGFRSISKAPKDENIEDMIYKAKVLGGEPAGNAADLFDLNSVEADKDYSFRQINSEIDYWKRYESLSPILSDSAAKEEFAQHVALWLNRLRDDGEDVLHLMDFVEYYEADISGDMGKIGNYNIFDNDDDDDDFDDEMDYPTEDEIFATWGKNPAQIKNEAVDFVAELKLAAEASRKYLNISMESVNIDNKIIDKIAKKDRLSYEDADVLTNVIDSFMSDCEDKADFYQAVSFPSQSGPSMKFVDRIAMSESSLEKRNVLDILDASLSREQQAGRDIMSGYKDDLVFQLSEQTFDENEELNYLLRSGAQAYSDLARQDIEVIASEIKHVVCENFVVPMYLDRESSRDAYVQDIAHITAFDSLNDETQKFLVALANNHARKVVEAHKELIEERNSAEPSNEEELGDSDGLDTDDFELNLDNTLELYEEAEGFYDLREESLDIIQNQLEVEENIYKRYKGFKVREEKAFGKFASNNKVLFLAGFGGKSGYQ